MGLDVRTARGCLGQCGDVFAGTATELGVAVSRGVGIAESPPGAPESAGLCAPTLPASEVTVPPPLERFIQPVVVVIAALAMLSTAVSEGKNQRDHEIPGDTERGLDPPMVPAMAEAQFISGLIVNVVAGRDDVLEKCHGFDARTLITLRLYGFTQARERR